MNDSDLSSPDKLDLMSFEEFLGFIRSHSITSFSDDFNFSLDANFDDVKGRINATHKLSRFPGAEYSEANTYSERSFFISLVGILHPYSVLRVLAENTENLSCDLVWQYGPLCENGWESADNFTPLARRHDRFLSLIHI